MNLPAAIRWSVVPLDGNQYAALVDALEQAGWYAHRAAGELASGERGQALETVSGLISRTPAVRYRVSRSTELAALDGLLAYACDAVGIDRMDAKRTYAVDLTSRQQGLLCQRFGLQDPLAALYGNTSRILDPAVLDALSVRCSRRRRRSVWGVLLAPGQVWNPYFRFPPGWTVLAVDYRRAETSFSPAAPVPITDDPLDPYGFGLSATAER